MRSQNTSSSTFTGAALAFVAGFVDAAAFIALTGLFTAHVTGNFVLIGAELVATSAGVLAKLLALPVFIAAVASARVLTLMLKRQGGRFFALAPNHRSRSARSVRPVWRPLVAAGCSRWNSVHCRRHVCGRRDGRAERHWSPLSRSSRPTTVMTVSVSQAVIDATDLTLGTAENCDLTRARFLSVLPAVAAFAAGALCGAFGIAHLAFGCVVLPLAVLIALIVLNIKPAEMNART